ncbi:uncharacterized protein J7T54_003186 [Emericellopsis cladophorae]|uniref:Carboxylic ester hydrolase n=1 Tax=Emericellopsis cladophorae TaxID=2686198 RepID=A0A9P9XUD2_9HYPO|nr:uncharacterized protein J7T54_003186 [Emericellopsis cladophorae]KAI6777941.1 hypothetical protein J7T54_003186 [Emericellopsis cladophorae]
MSTSLDQACKPGTFFPSIGGADILSLEAIPVTGYNATVTAGSRFTAPDVDLINAEFCNVTVQYVHTNESDHVISVEAWLPPHRDWNQRFLAVGGGGWNAGRSDFGRLAMSGAIADGFATIVTDAGLGEAADPSEWALLRPGEVDMVAFRNQAYQSLEDEALFGKALVQDFYGTGPSFSYFNGCSQGGRQGLLLAQRYPDLYDGIAAIAPAIHFSELLPYMAWGQQLMNEMRQYPHSCEFDAITAAALSACGDLDGVRDGLLSRVDACLATFDPHSMVNTHIPCAQLEQGQVDITKAAAGLVEEVWRGMPIMRDNRSSTYPGVSPGANLTGSDAVPVLLGTDCASGTCFGRLGPLAEGYIKYFLAKDPEAIFDTSMTREEFLDTIVSRSREQYGALVDASDPDLTQFHASGGKMVTWHGLMDPLIPHRATEDYYNAVAGISPDVQDFYRYFEAPGIEHCTGGPSQVPTKLFKQLQAWVEEGVAPDASDVQIKVGCATHKRILCAYPKGAVYQEDCGDPLKMVTSSS